MMALLVNYPIRKHKVEYPPWRFLFGQLSPILEKLVVLVKFSTRFMVFDSSRMIKSEDYFLMSQSEVRKLILARDVPSRY